MLDVNLARRILCDIQKCFLGAEKMCGNFAGPGCKFWPACNSGLYHDCICEKTELLICENN